MSPAHFPQPSTSFIGRERELIEIAGLLTDPMCRLLTIVGPGGIGKTRLALQVSSNQSLHFDDGVALVPLTAVASPGFLPIAIGEALDIPFFNTEELLSRIMGYLRDKRMLLVLDNCEHLLEGVGCLPDLLQAAPP